jgi:hypothetical protein
MESYMSKTASHFQSGTYGALNKKQQDQSFDSEAELDDALYIEEEEDEEEEVSPS